MMDGCIRHHSSWWALELECLHLCRNIQNWEAVHQRSSCMSKASELAAIMLPWCHRRAWTHFNQSCSAPVPVCNQNYWAAFSWLTDGLLVFVVEGMLWLWLFFCPFLSWSACWAIDLGKGKQTVRAIHFKYPERAHIWPTHFSMAWGKTTLNVS